MELSSPFLEPVLKSLGLDPRLEVLKITRVNGAVLAFSRGSSPFLEPVLKKLSWITRVKLSSPFLEPVLKITRVNGAVFCRLLSCPRSLLKITRVNGAVLAFSRACTEDH